MTQGFALRCVVTESTYKMIWMRKIGKISIHALQRRQNHLYALSLTTQHNATQALASYYKPAFMLVLVIKLIYSSVLSIEALQLFKLL